MVSFIQALKLTMARRFSVNCRISRSEYWWSTLWVVIYILAASFVGGFLGALIDLSDEGIGGLCVLFWLPSIVLSILLSIRRVHDLDMAGWWVLFMLLPYFGGFIVIGMCLVKGTPGPNRFGPDSLLPGINDHLLHKNVVPQQAYAQPQYQGQPPYQGQPQQYAPQQPVAQQQYAPQQPMAPQQPAAPQPAPQQPASQQPVPDFEPTEPSNQSDAPKS